VVAGQLARVGRIDRRDFSQGSWARRFDRPTPQFAKLPKK
jgi:hypothetical protein